MHYTVYSYKRIPSHICSYVHTFMHIKVNNINVKYKMTASLNNYVHAQKSIAEPGT